MQEPEVIQQMRRIVTNHQYEHIDQNEDQTIIDVQTAHVIITVYDAISNENRKKFCNYQLDQMVNIAWKLINKKTS